MGKHSSGDVPRTGDGRTGGNKPKRLEVTQKTKGGTILWRATAALFSKKKGGKR